MEKFKRDPEFENINTNHINININERREEINLSKDF